MARAALLGIAVATAWTVPVSAQYTPYAIAVPSERNLSETDRARDLMNRYGLCVVKQHFGLVRRAIAQTDDAAQTRALAKIAGDDCLSTGRLRMSPLLFRGSVYRALYIRDYALMPRDTLAALVATKLSDDQVSIDFGACVAKLSPDGARALVLSDPATTAEKNAIASLRPSLSDCLPPKAQVRVTMSGLQATLSEALYKRMVALQQAAQDGAK